MKIREDNHTDIPHTMKHSERDTLHEMHQSTGIDGTVSDQMLIMNCKYSERPLFTKKRYFLMFTLLGGGSAFRNILQKQIYETEFNVEKHVESVKNTPK